MSFQIKITFPSGPTIMAGDREPVEIRRECVTPDQLTAIQKAAQVLGAKNVVIERFGD